MKTLVEIAAQHSRDNTMRRMAAALRDDATVIMRLLKENDELRARAVAAETLFQEAKPFLPTLEITGEEKI